MEEEMLSIKRVLLFSCVMSFVMGSSICLASDLPTPEQCITCHSVGVVYEEWSASVHAEAGVGCFSCHISGKKQREAGLIDSEEKEGFHIVGYFNGAGFIRVEGNEVCVRCHDTAHHAGSRKAKCLNCHMPEEGLTTYRVHNYPDESVNFSNPESIPLSSVRKYVTRPHRVHKWSRVTDE